MTREDYSMSQILNILREHQAGLSAVDICRKYEIETEQLVKWRLEYTDLTQSRTHKLFRWIVKLVQYGLRSISPDFCLKALLAFINELDLTVTIQTKGGPIHFKCPSDTARIRANNLHHREPDTLNWIETFEPDDVFWDIGSNIGVFSLYAATVPSVQVVAIDPLPQNYDSLIQNLALNGLTESVNAFCIAITDRTLAAKLNIPAQSNMAGGAGCTFDSTQNNNDVPLPSVVSHTALGYSIDQFIETFSVPFPNHIKIDIDGVQDQAIRGAVHTLKDQRLKSIMVELQREDVASSKQSNDKILKILKDSGFSCFKTAPASPEGSSDRTVNTTNNFFHRA